MLTGGFFILAPQSSVGLEREAGMPAFERAILGMGSLASMKTCPARFFSSLSCRIFQSHDKSQRYNRFKMLGMTLLPHHSSRHALCAFSLLLVPEEMDFTVCDIGAYGKCLLSR